RKMAIRRSSSITSGGKAACTCLFAGLAAVLGADFREADFFFAAMFPPNPGRELTPASGGNLELPKETARTVADKQPDRPAPAAKMHAVDRQPLHAFHQRPDPCAGDLEPVAEPAADGDIGAFFIAPGELLA